MKKAEYQDKTKAVKIYYKYSSGRQLLEVTFPIMRFNYVDDRVPYSMEYSGQTYYLVYDQVGSLRAVVDTSGLIVKRIDYDSFGNVILDTDPTFRIPIGFAGGLYDSDTRLVRFGVRDYDPYIGRWTAKDPIDFAGGDLNLFGYVKNDPVNWIDPWGLLEVSPYPGLEDTWRYYGRYGARWSEFQKERDVDLDFTSYIDNLLSIFGAIEGIEVPTIINIEDLLEYILNPEDLETIITDKNICR